MMLTQHCHCGRSQREVVCGETGEKGEEERYGCSLVCGRSAAFTLSPGETCVTSLLTISP